MKCPICKQNLIISNCKPVSKNNEIKVLQTLVCVNSKCENYAGKDLNNPKKIVHTSKNDW